MSVGCIVFLPDQLQSDLRQVRKVCIKRGFNDDQCVLRHIFFLRQRMKNVMHCLRLVRRIHVNDIGFFFMDMAECAEDVLLKQDRFLFKVCRMQILLNARARLSSVLHKIRLFRAAAQRLDADRAASRSQVKEYRARHFRLYNLKEGLFNDILRGPCIKAVRRDKLQPSCASSYYSHNCFLYSLI